MRILNMALKRAIDDGTCLDLQKVGSIPPEWNGPGDANVFEMSEYNPEMQYADSATGRWAWSIGRRIEDGRIFVAFDGRFYGNGSFDCLFMR